MSQGEDQVRISSSFPVIMDYFGSDENDEKDIKKESRKENVKLQIPSNVEKEMKEDQNSFEFVSFTEFSENVKLPETLENSEIPSIENVENVEIVETGESLDFVNVEKENIEKNEDELFDELLDEPLETQLEKLMEIVGSEFDFKENSSVVLDAPFVVEESDVVGEPLVEQENTMNPSASVVVEETEIFKGEDISREISQETFEYENFYSTLLPWRPEFNILT
jgi:hypothetical protein